jgi:hypothetical protein
MRETLPTSPRHERDAQIVYLGQYVAQLLEAGDDNKHLLAIKTHYETETGSLLVTDKKVPRTPEPQQPKQEYPTDFDQWPDDER